MSDCNPHAPNGDWKYFYRVNERNKPNLELDSSNSEQRGHVERYWLVWRKSLHYRRGSTLYFHHSCFTSTC
jgi:hypothetical protein